jgi:small subunit ribosomal protein S4
MLVDKKEKLCRKYGQKLLMSERCENKCALDRRRTRPGVHGHKPKAISDYGRLLIEKQKLRYFYLLKNKQLKNLIDKCRKMKEPLPSALIKILESKIDNVVWRLGYVKSKFQARQLVSHGHFLVNGKRVKTSNYFLKPGDVIEIREKSKNLEIFKDLPKRLKGYIPPKWLKIDLNTLRGEFLRYPELEEVALPFDINLAIQFFSRY